MVEFKPDINGSSVNYTAFENGRQTGSSRLTIDNFKCFLEFVEASDDETAEGLIRSALNAAANRNSYICEYRADSFLDVAKLLGFKEDNGKLCGEIPFLLAGHCGCKGNCQ